MIYVALLRGINVGGNNKVGMDRLKLVFEQLGLSSVKTYINSGNVIFSDNTRFRKELTALLEAAIHSSFGFSVKVLLRDINEIKAINQAMPQSWHNGPGSKCDVMFLWEAVNNKDILKQLVIKPGIDDVKFVPGAIIWRVDRQNVTKSGLLKIVGTDLYKQITIRNCNTTRKLLGLMQQA